MSKADRIARIRKQTKAAFIFAEVVAAIITLSATIDCIFDLGWGYDWMVVLAGIGMMVWGGLIYLACVAIFKWTSRAYN